MVRRTIKRVTVNLPAQLLAEAREVSGVGITETVILGLQLLIRRRALERALELKGKLDLRIGMSASRERTGFLDAMDAKHGPVSKSAKAWAKRVLGS